ncbi:MAG: LPXTG cell wall anchor domain-containing protein, partial [Candidatus Dormibacteraeota bacterium]|nr:LPXTG cell wall anchor domain-containing protein [Candidatus Dormibacteraeota bacterium]
DVSIGQSSTNTPETPFVPALAVIGAVAIAAGALLGRRRRSAATL